MKAFPYLWNARKRKPIKYLVLAMHLFTNVLQEVLCWVGSGRVEIGGPGNAEQFFFLIIVLWVGAKRGVVQSNRPSNA